MTGFEILNLILWIVSSLGAVLVVSYLVNRKPVPEESVDDKGEKEGERAVAGQDKGRELDLKSAAIFVLLAAVSGMAAYFVSTNAASAFAWVELGLCYIAVLCAAVFDFRLRIIPNQIPLGLVIARALIFICEFMMTNTALAYLVSSLLGCFVSFLILMVASKISKGGVGGGDVKLMASLGFGAGIYAALTTLLCALIICAAVAVVLLITKKKSRKDSVPFAPFIYLGYVAVLLLSLY